MVVRRTSVRVDRTEVEGDWDTVSQCHVLGSWFPNESCEVGVTVDL